MIPYDDLVAALQAWRARQGLPVAEGAAIPGSGPRLAAAAPPPPRTNPPAPPASKMPMPLAAPDEEAHEELEEHAMIEESHYENEGDDFALSFAADGHNGHVSGIDEVAADGSETMVGHEPPPEPERPSDLTDPGAAHRNGRDDW